MNNSLNCECRAQTVLSYLFSSGQCMQQGQLRGSRSCPLEGMHADLFQAALWFRPSSGIVRSDWRPRPSDPEGWNLLVPVPRIFLFTPECPTHVRLARKVTCARHLFEAAPICVSLLSHFYHVAISFARKLPDYGDPPPASPASGDVTKLYCLVTDI